MIKNMITFFELSDVGNAAFDEIPCAHCAVNTNGDGEFAGGVDAESMDGTPVRIRMGRG